MKHRISRVTTRSGDTGSSSLATGARLPKTDPRFEAIGTVDELNSLLGVLLTHLPADGELHGPCLRVQQELFDLGATLATVGKTPPPSLGRLEQDVAQLNDALAPLTEFVPPRRAIRLGARR